ncbi:hypothetical protein MMPV_008621 [Pyropia vietnamensis]
MSDLRGAEGGLGASADSAASAVDAADSMAASAATPTADGGEPGPPSACPVAGCRVLLRGDIANRGGLAHLSLAHVIGEVPAEVATALGWEGAAGAGGHRPQRGLPPVAAPSADGGTAGDAAAAGAAPTAAAAGGTALFFADPLPGLRRARPFCGVAPAGALGAAGGVWRRRTAAHVPAALLRALRVLATDSLDWVRREPEQQHAWLWLQPRPPSSSTPLHGPAGAPDAPRPPLLPPARSEAVLNGEFSTAPADRNAGVWRPSWWRYEAGGFGGEGVGPITAAGVAAGAGGAGHVPLPPATPASASAASVEAEFAYLLADAAEFGDGATVPRGVTREAVREAIRSGGGDALVGVVELLVSAAAVTRVPRRGRPRLAGADLLLLAKPGGVGDGLPGLRPIGMPETLRKLAASALAATVWKAAAAFLGPGALGWGCRVRANASCTSWTLTSPTTHNMR